MQFPLLQLSDVYLIDDFSLSDCGAYLDHSPFKSRLMYEGRDAGVEIAGYDLDFQFQLDGCYLLFANWNCPFEESTEISLIDADMKLLDHMSIVSNESGFDSLNLELVEYSGANHFRLIFTDGRSYDLKVSLSRFTQLLPFAKRLQLSKSTTTVNESIVN